MLQPSVEGALVSYPSRLFQLWAYTVSHGSLLLRSTKTDDDPTRVDVLFRNVKALDLPTVLHGVSVAVAGPDATARVAAATGLAPDDDTVFFEVATRNCTGYVVAGAVSSDEDTREFHEASRYWPAMNGPTP